MAAKRKQEEKLVSVLRELAAMPTNKHCFDCAQRGPTYVDMTIGSFVCTSCSGILRGLNPPHRVKSISMATFSQEEIDFIRARGNELAPGNADKDASCPDCHTVSGLWDNRLARSLLDGPCAMLIVESKTSKHV